MDLIVATVTKVITTTSPRKPFKEAAAAPTEWEAFQINSFSHGRFSLQVSGFHTLIIIQKDM